MRKTVICMFPSSGGTVHDVFTFAHEYFRICEGLLGTRHQVHVLFCSEKLASAGDPLSHLLEPAPRPITAQELAGGLALQSSMKILAERDPNRSMFRVGRLILLFNDVSHFAGAPNPLTLEYLLAWIHQTVTSVQQESFDDLNVDLVAVGHGPLIDGVSENCAYRAIVAGVEHCQAIARDFAQSHLRLSVLLFKTVGFYFLDVFQQREVECVKAKSVKKDRVMKRIDQVCPCVLRNNQRVIVEELETEVIIFEGKYLLSGDRGRVFLSYVSDLCDQETVDEYAFVVPSDAGASLVSRMVPALKVGESGKNWVFNRTIASPALSGMTSLTELETDAVLFSSEFLRYPPAYELFGPILSVVSQPYISPEAYNMATRGMGWLFERIRADDTSFLPQERVKQHGKGHLVQRLLYELGQTLAAFQQASQEHMQLQQYFLMLYQRLGQAAAAAH